MRTGFSASPGDPDFYNDDGSNVGNEVPIGAFILILVVIVAALFGGWRSLSGGGDEVEIIGSPPATASGVSTPAGTAAPTGTQAAPTTAQSTTGDSVLDGLLRAIGLVNLDNEAMLELRDLIGDALDSIFGVMPAYQGSDVDIARTVAMLTTVNSAFVVNAFGNTVYPCGDPAPLVVCAADVLEMPALDRTAFTSDALAPHGRLRRST